MNIEDYNSIVICPICDRMLNINHADNAEKYCYVSCHFLIRSEGDKICCIRYTINYLTIRSYMSASWGSEFTIIYNRVESLFTSSNFILPKSFEYDDLKGLVNRLLDLSIYT